MNNPHSAKERIQNHLAYKLGLALIQYHKQSQGIPSDSLISVRGGGGFFSLLSLSPFLNFFTHSLKSNKPINNNSDSTNK